MGTDGLVLTSIASKPDDLLVLGAGRRGSLRWMFRSQVTRYCAVHARCPVVLVPPPELVRELRRFRLASTFWHRTLTPGDVLGNGNTQPGGGPVRA
jgi:hypothetical protein